MRKRELSTEFVKTINQTIETEKIKKSQVADLSGIDRSTVTRIFAGQIGVNKPTARAILRSINTIAGAPVLDERLTLQLGGFDDDETFTLDYDLGDGARLSLDEKFSKKEQKEIVEVMKIAFEIAVRKHVKNVKSGT